MRGGAADPITDSDALADEGPAAPRGPGSRSLKRLAGVAALLALALGVSAALWYRHRASPLEVRVARVARGPIALRIPAVAPGRVMAAGEVAVRSEIAGRIARVFPRAGARVAKGDALVEFDTEELEGSLRAAEQAWVTARAAAREAALRARLARRSAKRGAQLVERGATTRVDAETAQFESLISEQAARAADSRGKEQAEQVARARRALARSRLHAPCAGIVTSLGAIVGEAVAPGAPLVTLADVSALHVSAHIDEADIARVQVGMPVEIGFESQKGTPIRSFVASIEAQVTKNAQGSHVLGIEVALDANSRLRVGMSAEVDVIAQERAQALVLPLSALSGIGKTREVFVVVNGVAELRRIEVGISSWSEVEVARGLQLGDLVVDNSALLKLSAGREVRWDPRQLSAEEDHARR